MVIWEEEKEEKTKFLAELKEKEGTTEQKKKTERNEQAEEAEFG